MTDLMKQMADALRPFAAMAGYSFRSINPEHTSRADEALAAYEAAEATIDGVGVTASFQSRVAPWMEACHGPEISADKIERNHRFLEEALELVQAIGCTKSEAHQLVDYVYGRPQGDINQEVGGVMVTLAALCLANGLNMHEAGETELERIWTKVEQIRAKQAAKPKHSPLPQVWSGSSQTSAARDVLAERERQQSAEGWTPEHDDDQADEKLLDAAFCYAKPDILDGLPIGWPWAPSWWKPTTRRRDLVKAGALILAEIERIDRADASAGGAP